MKNPYYPIDTVVEDIIDETPTIKTFVLKPARPFSFKAGQFMQLTVPGVGEAPFTPSSSPSVTEKMEITQDRQGHRRATRARTRNEGRSARALR